MQPRGVQDFFLMTLSYQCLQRRTSSWPSRLEPSFKNYRKPKYTEPYGNNWFRYSELQCGATSVNVLPLATSHIISWTASVRHQSSILLGWSSFSYGQCVPWVLLISESFKKPLHDEIIKIPKRNPHTQLLKTMLHENLLHVRHRLVSSSQTPYNVSISVLASVAHTQGKYHRSAHFTASNEKV